MNRFSKKSAEAIADHKNILYILLVVAAFIALLVRCFFSVVTTDEVFNIGEVYRTVLGQKFLIENWDFFQVGDSLSYPLIWIFHKINKSSEGIVLYSRICAVAITFIFGFVSYRFLKPIFGKFNSFAACLIYYTVVTKTMFAYWYDTWSLSFMLLSFIVIVYSLEKGSVSPWLIVAGALQAVSVYSYPTAVFVFAYEVVLLFCYINKNKKAVSFKKPELAYIAGAAIIFLIFVLFCLTRDFKDFFIFDSERTSEGLSDRTTTLTALYFRVKIIVYWLFKYFWIIFICAAIFFALCIVVKKHRKLSLFIPIYTVISALFIYGINRKLDIAGSDTQNQIYILFYFGLCCLPLHCLFFNKSQKHKLCFIFLYIPSFVAGIIWSITGLNGPINFPVGARSGSIFFFLELFEFISAINKGKNIKKLISCSTLCALLLFNVYALYSSAFQSTVPLDMIGSGNVCKINSGIYKGIYDNKDTSLPICEFEKKLNSIKKDGDETILCGRELIYGYLMSDLKPNTNYLWVPGSLTGSIGEANHYDILFEYFDSYYGYPDIVVLQKDQMEKKNKKLNDFIDENYYVASEDSEAVFYHIK